MYTMKADGVLFHNPAANDPSRMAIGTEAEFELNKAGSLTFTLPPDNVVYHALKKRKSVVQLYQDGEMLFQGRVIDTVSDLQNMQEVYCEGDLNLLMDSVQPAMEFDGTAEEYLRQAISNHNAVMEADKHFVVGDVTAVEEKHKVKVKSTDYTDTLGDLRSLLVDEFGGYLRVRYIGTTRYLDYIKEYTSSSGQSVKFGVNLVDIEKRMDAQKLFTILLPVGKVEKGKRTTIADVNGGSIYLEDASAVAAYGRIIQTEKFDNVTDPQELLEKAQEYLNRVKENRSITIRAVDMKIVDPDVDNILLGDRVVLDSFPHDLNESEICAKVVLQLDAPDQSEYTFGIPPSTLTDQIASRIKQTSTSIDKLREWLTVTDTELILAKEHVSEYGDIINNVRLEMDALNAEIKLVATQHSIDELVQRVTNAEVEIDGIDAQIKLLATQHTIEELVNRVTQAEIELDGINATIDLKASKSEVTELSESLSQAGIRIDGIESAVELKASKDETNELQRRLSQAEIDIDGAKAQIALKASVADFEDLDSRVSQAEVNIDGANAAIALKASKDEVVGLTKRVSQAEIDINGAEAAIALKASQSDVQGLTKRVSQAEIDIDGANQQIGLFAGQVDELGNRLDGAEITIDGLNKQIALKASQKDVDDVSERLSQAEINIDGVNSMIGLMATKEETQGLTKRLSNAEVAIDGANAAIALKATKSELEGVEDRVAQAEVDIDAANAAISLKANQTIVNSLSNRMNTAEADINAAEAAINLKASQSSVTALTNRVSTAELDINAAKSAINLKASQSDVTKLGNRVSSAELRIDGAESAIRAKADLILLDGYVKASELETETLKVVDGATLASLKTGSFNCSGTGTINTLYATGAVITNLNAPNAILNGSNYTAHSHKVTVNSDGTVTLGEVSSTGGSFKIADTAYYKNGVSAARTAGVNSVNFDVMYGSGGVITARLTNGKEGTLQLSQGTASGKNIPIIGNRATVMTVNASSVYNNGVTSGRNGVTLSAAGWQGGSNVISASNGKSVTVSLPSFSTSGGTSWSNNKTTVYFSTSSVNGYLASKTVDASSVYTSGVNSGKSAVTLSAAGWVGSNNVVSASNGKSVTVSLPTFSTSGGTSWSSHKTTVYFSTPSVSGALKSVTVDATSEYNSGVTSGKNAVTLSAAGWKGSSNVVSASNGKSVTVRLPTFSTSGGTSWSNNKTTVYFSTPSVSGALASKTVDATSVYNAGYTAGEDSVTLSASGWSGNVNTITASNGKSMTVTRYYRTANVVSNGDSVFVNYNGAMVYATYRSGGTTLTYISSVAVE